MDRKIFFTFQNGGKTVNAVINLYSSQYPNTTKNFLNNCISSEQNYKFSQLTRIVSPEFIVQGGNIVRQTQILDPNEYHADRSLFTAPGKLAIVSNPNNADELQSNEFFITLANLSNYEELDNYMVIGEVISELQELVEWGKNVKVNEDGIPLEDIIISRCGEVVKKQQQQHRGGGESEHGVRSSNSSTHHHRHSSHDSRRRHEDTNKDRSYRSSRSHKSHHSSSSKENKESDRHSSRNKRSDGGHHYKRQRSRDAR